MHKRKDTTWSLSVVTEILCTSVRSVASGANSRLYFNLRFGEDTREVSDALCSLQVLHQKDLVSWTSTEKQCAVLAAVE